MCLYLESDFLYRNHISKNKEWIKKVNIYNVYKRENKIGSERKAENKRC